jgi:hypothetical protein
MSRCLGLHKRPFGRNKNYSFGALASFGCCWTITVEVDPSGDIDARITGNPETRQSLRICHSAGADLAHCGPQISRQNAIF